MSSGKNAIIIGAGPAGLTAAYELLKRTDIAPVVLEQSGEIGGLSRTINYKGNRIDIGGHRFYSKSDRIVDWWTNILPLQGSPARDYKKSGIAVPLSPFACQHRLGEDGPARRASPDPEQEDQVFLVRQRLSRIYFLRKLINYPVRASLSTIRDLGLRRTARIAASYLRTIILPIRPERSLEDFFINRFGRELYQTFFKDYTEKVWGVPCDSIKPAWGVQRIRGLSVGRTIRHALKELFRKDGAKEDQNVEASLIGRFMYPKYGPGQLWEEVAGEITRSGGEIRLYRKVVGMRLQDGRIASVTVRDMQTGEERKVLGDHVISTMPVRELIEAMDAAVPHDVRQVASGLRYRDFLTVGLLVDELSIKNRTRIRTANDLIPDNWIYVQDKSVRLGRIQIFNNWSPYMVRDPDKVWLGLEYFCQEGDELWSAPDRKIIEQAGQELEKIGVTKAAAIRDGVVIRMQKAYPAYFGSYDEFGRIRKFTDGIANLYLIGRNGMHRYNNMDHSMMTAMKVVDNIVNGVASRDRIWQVNAEEEYHE